jgi:predicted dehydrogenase/threonine dehydrogenase-like Zn-dependent dehydrogenase
MKQLAQYQDGRLELQDVPDPVPPPGGIVVKTVYSVISSGTEKMQVEQARMNLLRKARARPDQVRKVLDTARTLGWRAALDKVKNRLESPTPLGYSAAGVVVAVDDANIRFRVGDRVACGGAECAHHAELIAVPDLLAAPVPSGVPLEWAAYTTLCAIALQAVRQADVPIGAQVLVLGQGLVGQLATGILNAAGVRVLGVDLVDARLAVAQRMGAERVANPRDAAIPDVVREWTDGAGVDAVLLCVGGKSPDPAALAVTCLRDRGTLVIVGIYDAPLEWKTYYHKEIQVRYSRSYGPGRYDPAYEWGGHDYPAGYVRWTENRNFAACLQLIASGRLNLAPVTTRLVPFRESLAVYNDLVRSTNGDIGVVLGYDGADPTATVPAARLTTAFEAVPQPRALARLSPPCTTLDVVGAGNFARTMLLPHLQGGIAFGTIVNHTGLSARHVQAKFGFAAADTDAPRVLRDAGPQTAVLIATRHDLHAPFVLAALRAGRPVFVEKPLCLTPAELEEIDRAVMDGAATASVMVGFNRRFAPVTAVLRRLLAAAPGPKTLSYHVNAGPLAPDHWFANLAESGGRVLGEACHFFDYACYVLDARPRAVFAQPLATNGATAAPDAVAVQIECADGSSAQVVYSAAGDSAYPKETFRISASGLVAECENFQTLTVHRRRKARTEKFGSKGHREEMAAWLAYLRGTADHPLPYADASRSMRVTFAVLDSIREHRAIHLTAGA